MRKPKGIEEFDETFTEPHTAGSEYQRQLLKRYSAKGTAVLEPPRHASLDLERTLSTERRSTEHRSLEHRPSLERRSLDTPPSLERRSLSGSPTFQRQGSLRLPSKAATGRDVSPLDRTGSMTSPRSHTSPRSVEEDHVEERSNWWGSFDSAYLNRQVVEGDENYRAGSFKPQYDVAGNPMHYADHGSAAAKAEEDKTHSEIQSANH